MSKILIIPDVHGRTFWHKAKEMIDSVDKVVFLGDYLDPYPEEHISRLDAIKEFKEIIKFKKDNPNKVILLLGNHDCAYCFDFGSATRYDYTNSEEIKSIFNVNKDLFKLFHKEENYLFSHAGVNDHWLKAYFNCSIGEFLELPESEIIPKLWTISCFRGGCSLSGSIIWNDIKEIDKETTYYQIFGHTQLKSEPIITDKWACLDVRKCFLLNTENFKITEV